MQISFDSLLQLDLNLIGLVFFNSFFLQKTNSRNKIQLSIKLIIHHYSKTKYKMYELNQNKYDNAF